MRRSVTCRRRWKARRASRRSGSTLTRLSFPQIPSSFATDEHRRELTLILQLVLADFKEVEGGFWSAPDGFLAYAYPSYAGGGVPKKDVPEAEAARIAAVAQAALNSGSAQTQSFPSETETLILRAEPVGAGDAPTFARRQRIKN